MSNKKLVFEGASTALITPFSDGEIDYPSLGKIIESQINEGISALVLLGTTGEASTISEGERQEIISFAKSVIKKRVPLIVGTGTNNTEVTLRYSRNAYYQGADGLLIVTPYYNKSTPKGLCDHYLSVAKAVDLPIIIYNVPSRTGVNIPISVYSELSRVENLVGIKEASGNIPYLAEILDTCGDLFAIYTGNDDLILPTLALGGKGAISVVSNLMPKTVSELCSSVSCGDIKKGRELQLYLSKLIKAMFIEVNPIPVKYAMSVLGYCQNQLRLPLCISTKQEEILSVLREYSLCSL